MTLTLNLQPDIERDLLAQARDKGVSLAEYAQEILTREAKPQKPRADSEAKNLVELFEGSPFKGLNMEFERDKDYGREIEL